MVGSVAAQAQRQGDDGAEAVQAVAGRRKKHTLGASTEEIEAAGEAVASALCSPLMRRAAMASEVRRECALTVMLDDGIIVEGVADLAFIEGEGAERHWIILDFKTDLEISGRLDEYRTQLALYLRAVRQATGIAARGILLWI